MLTPVTLSAAGITFERYPFGAASVFPGGLLPWRSVREVVESGFPPQIRTHRGEVLFVPYTQKEELIAAARERGLPCVRRVDVWSLLLEPFLDTEFDDAMQAATSRLLAENGVSPAEAERIRGRVASMMGAYNFGTGLWEWAHLGLYDLLLAAQLATSGRLRCKQPSDIHTLYWDAMAIAEQGAIDGPPAG